MSYSFIADSSKAVLHRAVDFVFPRNAFIASATGTAGVIGHMYGRAFAAQKINKIIWEQMNCSQIDHGAEFVATEISKSISKKFLESVGLPVAGAFDKIFGNGEVLTNMVNDISASIKADFTQAINCASANAAAMAVTPYISDFMAYYYYPTKSMLITTVTLNMIALTLLKIRTFFMSSEQIELEIQNQSKKMIELPAPKTTQEKPEKAGSIKELPSSDTTLALFDEKLKKFETEYSQKQLLQSQNVQNKLDAITNNLETLTSALAGTVKKIEETNSRQTALAQRLPIPLAARVKKFKE